MITFITLFLQLVVGSHPVEVAVGGAVVEIDLRLDGRSIGVLRGEPWSLDCDFGAQLAPHELVAIGFDSSGRQVARADQWINLPRHRSQVELVPDASDDGPPRSVRLVWRSVDGSQPDEVRVSFDGQLLPLADPSRVELPPYDPDALHLLQAELQFGPSTAYGEIGLGGSAAEVGSALTSFPVMLAGKGKPPSPAEMVGWFRKSGRPLRVVAVERGPADLLMVQDQSARTQGQLGQLRHDALNRRSLGDSAAPRPSGLQYRDRLRVVVPQPVSGETGLPGLFPISPDLASLRRGPTSTGVGRRLVAGPRPEGLLAALPYPAGVVDAPQRLADAVAEAGRAAAAGRRARVLVLVTGGEPSDESRFDPATVRAYLRLLQVPLLVWSPEAAKGWDAWGEVEKISSPSRLFRAVRGVRALLDRQLVVWLEGQHLPQEIELSPQAAHSLVTVGDSIPRSSRPTKPEDLPRIAAEEPAATPTPAAAEPGALSGAPGPPAETPGVEPTSIFMEAVDVSVVNVTAVVTDSLGRRVLDLARGDFEIYEDGRLQEITHFAVPQGPATRAARGPEPGGSEPFHLLAFVDTSRLRMAHRKSVIEALRDVLQRVSAPVMLVVFDGAVQIRQGFTTDLEQMMAALAEIETEIGRRPEPTVKESRGLAAELAEVESEFESARRARDPYALERARTHRDSFLVQVRVHGEVARQQIRATLEAIQRFAASLGPVAGRKVLLYVGDQLVMRPASELYLGIERADLDLTQTELSRLGFEATTLSTEREFQAMTRQANGSGVTFYSLTPPSLEHPGAVRTASAGSAGLQVWMRNERSAAVREAVCLISYSTGGLCQVEGSDPQLLLHDALADFASSYSLGYSSGREADGRFHKIEVKVKGPDLNVRHREGYLAKPRQDRLRDRLIATLLYGAEDNVLGVTLRFDDVEPLEGKKTQLLPMDVRVPVPRLALLPLSGSDRREARLRLILAVAGAAGRISKVQEYPIRFQVSEEQLTEVPPPLYVHNVRLTIESAVQRVAVGLWDEIGLVGSFLQLALEHGVEDAPAVVSPSEPRP